MTPALNLIQLQGLSMLEQLHIEEALLRADHRNWCLVHSYPQEAIVMGISTQPDQVVDFLKWHEKPVPLLRRFSGGGTVFIDKNCLMVTFICNQADLKVPCFPQPVLQWSEAFYKPIFNSISFNLRENDYVIGEKKIGGNAQYMTKQRWLHHTSFLWDYEVDNMLYLKMPPKMPQYRAKRSHQDFLCKLNKHFSSSEEFSKCFLHQLSQNFDVKETCQSLIKEIRHLPHRRSTVEVGKELLRGAGKLRDQHSL